MGKEYQDRCSIGSICTLKCQQSSIAISQARGRRKTLEIRERVGCARERHRARFRRDTKTNCNARMGPCQIKLHCKLTDESQELICVALTQPNLRARAYDRILKVLRTV